MQEHSTTRAGKTQAIILIKAAPIIGAKHGETVCCAGIDLYGNWLRMYPVSFRVLDDGKKFKRWDRVEFKWRRPTEDQRVESRHVDSQSLEIVGRMPDRERASFLDSHIVTSLNEEHKNGRSLALLKPDIQSFRIERKPKSELDAEQARIDNFHNQDDMFIPRPALPQKACPFNFKYKYTTDDGTREGTCQDWETEAAFFKWRMRWDEQETLARMQHQFGEVLPKRGLYFAMGTHSRWPDKWLINGLIQLKQSKQATLF